MRKSKVVLEMMLLIAAALLKKTDYLELTYRERCEKLFQSFAVGN